MIIMGGFDPEHGLNKKEKQKRRQRMRLTGKQLRRQWRKQTAILSDTDRDLFLAMLESDAKPNEAMKLAAAEYKSLRESA